MRGPIRKNKSGRSRGQSWGTFLRNHTPNIAAMDLFVVPTISFNLLYVLVNVRLARRELVCINVTAHPTAEQNGLRSKLLKHSLGTALSISSPVHSPFHRTLGATAWSLLLIQKAHESAHSPNEGRYRLPVPLIDPHAIKSDVRT